MAVQELQDTIAEVAARVGPSVVGLGRGPDDSDRQLLGLSMLAAAVAAALYLPARTRLADMANRLVYGEHFIGELKEAPGAEPLRGIHLRRIIVRQFADEYLRAVILSRAVPEILLNPALEQALSSTSPSITPR